MTNKRKIYLDILLFFLFSINLCGQTRYSMTGIVMNDEKNPLDAVSILIPDLNYWTYTDEDGFYEIKNIPPGNYQAVFKLLGYNEQRKTLVISSDTMINIKLQKLSLALDEVVVTAQPAKLGSSYLIGEEAMRHLQAKSLSDAFMLLPGHITQNPTLANPQQVQIREISKHDNSALGTSIILDGVIVNNDADRQTFNTANSGNSTSTYGTSGSGVDLRNISMEDIESVEVIRGIPSAEYGNITSKVVIVKTKKGETPLNARAKTDFNTKIFSVYKGFRLPEERGIVNAGVDYTQAYDDLRTPYTGYERVTMKIAYAKTFMKKTTPLTFEVNFNYFGTLDENKSDPQFKADEKVRSSTDGFRLGISGKWALRKKWINNLEYTLSTNYTINKGFRRQSIVISSGAVPYPTSMVDGEYKADYLPGTFYSEYTIYNQPFNSSVKIKADQVIKTAAVSHKIMAGAELSLSDNYGKGLVYDLSRPPFYNLSASLRPRAYNDIPAIHTTSFFAEDKIVVPIGTTELSAQVGMRLIYTTPGNFLTMDPRANLSYEFLNKKNNSLFDRFSLNVGFGITSKAPVISYISPDNAYFDEVSLNYYDKDHPLAVVTTQVVDTRNEDLKPAKSVKFEAGPSFRIKPFEISITGFYDKMTNGFSYQTTPYNSVFRKFSVTGSGKMPTFSEGNVYYDENGIKMTAPYTQDTILRSYNKPSNTQVLIKKGIEYAVTIDKIEPIRTSFVIDGAWLYQETYSDKESYSTIISSYLGKTFPYMAIFPGYAKTISQRVNTNIRSITHVPLLNMIVSLTTQIIWSDKFKYRWDDKQGKSIVYYYNEEGHRVTGTDAVYKEMKTDRYVDPIAYVGTDGIVHPWKEELSEIYPFSSMVKKYVTTYYFKEENLPPTVQFNIRVTKEFGKNLEISFMANNFLKMHPLQKSNRDSLYVKRNSGFYFGAELNYKF